MIFDFNNSFLKYNKRRYDELGALRVEAKFKYFNCFCGEVGYKIISTTSRHRNHLDVVQCKECGTLRINPYLDDASIGRYYTEIYGEVKRSNKSPENLYKLQQRYSQQLLDSIGKFLTPFTVLLDYGGGPGGVVESIRKKVKHVYIKESDQNYFNFAISNGLIAYEEDMKYDFIVLSHVVEHINDPLSFLSLLKISNLSDNGYIYIEVPYIENSRYLLNDIHLAHKFYFTQLSLEYLISLAGYKIVDSGVNYIIIHATTKDKIKLPPNKKMMSISNQVIRKNNYKKIGYLPIQMIKYPFKKRRMP